MNDVTPNASEWPEENIFKIPLSQLEYADEQDLKSGLEANFGIQRAHINLFEGVLTVYYDNSKIRESDIERALAEPGYKVKTNLLRRLLRYSREHGSTFRFFIAVVFMIASLSLFRLEKPLPGSVLFPWYILFNGGVLLMGLPRLIRSLIRLFTRGRVTVELLVLLVASSALAIGHWLEAAAIVFVSLLGQVLEKEAASRAHAGLKLNTVLGTRSAQIKHDGDTVEVPLHEIKEGDIVVVKQGMTVPVDGTVVSGRAEIRQAALTGESVYHTRSEGSQVFAGGIVAAGAVEVKAERVGKGTALADIDRLVDRATRSKAPVERTIDKASGFLLAGVIIVFWLFVILRGQTAYWMHGEEAGDVVKRIIATLIGICPFALLLASPMGMYLGILSAAMRGLIFKNGFILQKLANVNLMLMDKTGTLTYGRTAVGQVKTFGSFSERNVMEAAYFVEQSSSHPMAEAICEYARKMSIEVQPAFQFLEFEGVGACAMKEDMQVKVGSIRLMDDGREIPDEVTGWVAEQAAKGRATALVGDLNDIFGGLVFEDEVRDDAASTIAHLRQTGIKKVMIVTGDSKDIAAKVQKQLDVDDAIANCLPESKMQVLGDMKRSGYTVAMVGDGINDAPALAAADVGIAMGAMGSDAAIEAADVALLNDDLMDLWRAIKHSRTVMHIIYGNVIFAIICNVLMAYLALYGIINIIGGAFLQMVLILVVAATSLGIFLLKR